MKIADATRNNINIIQIPEDKLVALIEKAYELSRPQGLGFLHYQEGSMPPGEAQKFIDYSNSNRNVTGRKDIYLDYVSGRAVKLSIWHDKDQNVYFMEDIGTWFDHTASQWEQLKSVLN